MKKKISFAVLLLSFSSLFAQNVSYQANTILDNTVSKYNLLSNFSFDFSLKIENGANKSQEMKGVLIVKKEKYFLTFEDQIIANDGVMLWNFNKSTNEAELFDAELDEEAFSMYNPIKMLNNWKKEYNAKYIGKKELKKKMNYIVELTPKKRLQFDKIGVYIDEISNYFSLLKLYAIDGTIITYSITKFTPNAKIEDAMFSFNKKDYPNVQVIDMR